MKSYQKIENQFNYKKTIGVLALIETPESVLNALSIAKVPRVNGLLLGAEDLATYLGVERTLEAKEIEFARNMVIYAAKSVQIDAIDTPFVDTSDLDGLKFDTTNGKNLGMTAKSCIHPNQIELINLLFIPSKDELDYAHKILLAKKKADIDGLGAFSVDGKMIDEPIIKRAEQIIEKAKG